MRGRTAFEKDLKEAARIACETEYQNIKNKTEDYKYAFSDVFIFKMEKMLRELYSLKNRKNKIRLKRILIIAAVIALNVTAVLANDGLREKIGNFIVSLYENYVEIKSKWFGEKDNEEFHKYELSYIPAGYELDYEEYTEEIGYKVSYVNEKGSMVFYGQYDSAATNIMATYEAYGSKEQISVCGVDAGFISDGEMNMVFFENGGYIFTVSTQEERSELIEIVEGITCWKITE